MPATLEIESTLTDRYQTTVPETVRRALKLGKRDKIHYSILPDGAVIMSRATQSREDDPILGRFLDFLAQDIVNHPAHIQSINMDLVSRIQSLTANIELDLDAPLSADDE